MSAIIVVALLTAFMVIGFAIWWMVDEVDIPNVAVMFGSPMVGIAVIYWYSTLLAWVFGGGLIALGLFVAYLKCRKRPGRGMQDPPG